MDASIEAPEGGKLYIDAYSGTARFSVTGDHGAAEVKAIGVGGELLSTSIPCASGPAAISPRMTSCWTGCGPGRDPGLAALRRLRRGRAHHPDQRPALPGGRRRPPGRAILPPKRRISTAPASSSPTAPWAALDENSKITCYEIVLPDPITGFGLSTVSENFDTELGDVLENQPPLFPGESVQRHRRLRPSAPCATTA